MASNRNPQKDYRINRRGRKVTSSADRSKRAKKASAPRPTSSSTRSRGKGTGSTKVTSDKNRVTKKPVTGGPRGAQGPRTAPQQGPGRAVKGLIGSTTKSKPSYPAPPSIRSSIKAGAGTAAKVTGLARSGPVRAAGAIIAGAIADAMKRSRKQTKTSNENKGAAYRAQQKKLPKVKMPAGPKKDTAAQSFDKAFAKARKAGKKQFTWRGKQYNTKMA